MSRFATTEPAPADPFAHAPQLDRGASDWPPLPTETEIYILPDGRVVVADLPAELAALVAQLGVVEPCAVDHPVSSTGPTTNDE
jgi:hypothetical protein